MNLTVGDDNGRIWVYELGEVIAEKLVFLKLALLI